MFFKKWYFLLIILLSVNMNSCKTKEISHENYGILNLTKIKIGETDYYITLPENWYIVNSYWRYGYMYYIVSDEKEIGDTIHGVIDFFHKNVHAYTEHELNLNKFICSVTAEIFMNIRRWEIYYSKNDEYFSFLTICNENKDGIETYINLVAEGKTKDEVIEMIAVYSSLIKN